MSGFFWLGGIVGGVTALIVYAIGGSLLNAVLLSGLLAGLGAAFVIWVAEL